MRSPPFPLARGSTVCRGGTYFARFRCAILICRGDGGPMDGEASPWLLAASMDSSTSFFAWASQSDVLLDDLSILTMICSARMFALTPGRLN